MKQLPLLAALGISLPSLLFAQATPTVKQAPPPGIAVPDADAAELKAGLDTLGKEIESLRGALESKPDLLALLPDVEVFHKAVRYAFPDEIFKPQEIAAAKAQLALGMQRAKELRDGKPSWATATGPLVRGYTSKIDGSVQPYTLIVPEDWKPGDKTPRPLYLWFHGRGDTLTELSFIAGGLKAKRDFATPNAFELRLYGRYCNASKFAGETDCFEAMDAVGRHYAIDPNRLVEMGFSMGGATAWHMGAHHAGLWAAASAGAGFAETAVYAKVFDPKKEVPPWWEQVLWRYYDAVDYAANLGNVPMVAYNGEIDPQRQSADMMDNAMTAEGLKLERLIGPNTAHKYEPETKKELSKRIDALVAKGRDPMPAHIRFVTYTLRYNQMKWITLDALDKHWERAEIEADLVDEGGFQVKTKNIAGFTIALPVAPAPLDKTHPPRVVIDGQEIVGPPVKDFWTAHFAKTDGKWALSEAPAEAPKHHGMTGPVDEAFTDSFIFVAPTGTALNEKVGAWSKSELDRAIVEWHRVFRGDARVKNDNELTADDIANSNLVLWGDPGSNAALAKILPKLPIQWTKNDLKVGSLQVSAADCAPILIYPNPMNPKRYVVLNSSFTFRQGSTTSNSLQTPKLPDWAVIDLRTPPSLMWPGLVVDAGFFDERWQLPTP